MKNGLFAAIDLGSNSFRLQLGQLAAGQLWLQPMIREPVRLAAGLTADLTADPVSGKYLDDAAQQRGLQALQGFREILHERAVDHVGVVATNTLRVAENAGEFLQRAERVLGLPIRVISGAEEARLIYLGVRQTLTESEAAGRQLVIDIGGGSTEIVLGENGAALQLNSLSMGCIDYTQHYFPAGRLSVSLFERAQQAALHQLQTVAVAYRQQDWQQVFASSGTAKAIADLLWQNQLNDAPAHGAGARAATQITQGGMQRLQAQLLRYQHVSELQLSGLRADRSAVLPGGLAIMSAIFKAFDLSCLQYSTGGLCFGVLHELLQTTGQPEARIRHEQG